MPIALYTHLRTMPISQLLQQPETTISAFARELDYRSQRLVTWLYKNKPSICPAN